MIQVLKLLHRQMLQMSRFIKWESSLLLKKGPFETKLIRVRQFLKNCHFRISYQRGIFFKSNFWKKSLLHLKSINAILNFPTTTHD